MGAQTPPNRYMVACHRVNFRSQGWAVAMLPSHACSILLAHHATTVTARRIHTTENLLPTVAQSHTSV
jgi:hypothetical protein